MKLFFFALLPLSLLLAQETPSYTLSGKKDPRLEAGYSLTYVATILKSGCSVSGSTTGTLKPSFTKKTVILSDGNYQITLPLMMVPQEDTTGCGYRLSGLELSVQRKGDPSLYSRFQLLGDFKRYTATQEPIFLYRGSKEGELSGGFAGMSPQETPQFITNKPYFRIAPETTFACMTQERVFDYPLPSWQQQSIAKFGHTDFICAIQMKSDTQGGKYHFNECTKAQQQSDTQHQCGKMTHPEFGVNEISNGSLRIDIVVDESKCQLLRYRGNLKFTKESDTFREVPQTATSPFQSFKSRF
jgi:hypothetical protein